ncbi:MAG: hypothetical protein IKX68_08635 [Clostridiales bacterium]|nr:hypothetical protein [Clostridiales bacterium]
MDDIRINNPHLKRPEEVRNCPKCGARLLSEVCQFCGTYIGEVATGDLTPEYPLVQCKNGKLGFWNIGFPFMFGGIFLGVSLPMLIIFLATGFAPWYIILFFIPFILIGVISIIVGIRAYLRHLSVKKHGVVRTGVVYGYMDDTVAYNNVNAQKIKILLDTSEGKKFILLPLGTTTKPYEVNSEVQVMLMGDSAMIIDKPIKW